MDNYQKVNWKDRVDSGNKYAIRDNPDGSKAINYVGTVEVHGTEVNAENLNHMDDGIFKNNKEIANRVPMVHLDSVSTSNNLNDLIISSTESESVKIFDSSSTTKSFSNKPIQVNTPFILTVSRIKKSEADTDSVQRQEFTASSNHKTYERFYSSNVWSDWTEVGTGGGSGGHTYSGIQGIVVDNSSDTIAHTNITTPGTIGSKVGTGSSIIDIGAGDTFTVPYASYDENGHITTQGKGVNTYRLSSSSGGSSYIAGSGIEIQYDASINKSVVSHSNGVEPIDLLGNNTETLSPRPGGKFKVPALTYDTEGHITGAYNTEITLPNEGGGGGGSYDIIGGNGIIVRDSTATADTKIVEHARTVTPATVGPDNGGSLSPGDSFDVPTIKYDATGHVIEASTKTYQLPSGGGGGGGGSYYATGGIKIETISGNDTIMHSNQEITGGTAGTTSIQEPTYGALFDIPYITYDNYGHITAAGTSKVRIPLVTKYSAGSGISLEYDALTGNTVISQQKLYTAAGSVGDRSQAFPGEKFSVPYIEYDINGHIIRAENREYDVPVNGGGGGTTYTGENGITVNNSTNKIGHSNSITAGSVGSHYGRVLNPGAEFVIPVVSYDDQGHIVNGTEDATFRIGEILGSNGITVSASTVPSDAGQITVKHSNSVSGGAGSAGPTSGGTLNYSDSFDVPRLSYDAYGHITGATTQTFTLPASSGGGGGTSYTGRWGIEVTSSYIQHSTSYGGNSTLGESGKTITNSTSGGTIKVPYITIDSYGHITSGSSQTMTIKDPTYNINSQSPGPGGTGGTHHVSPGDGTQIYIPSLAIENSGRISNAYDHCYIIDGPSTMPFTAYGESSSQSQETCVPFTTCTSADNDEYSMRISDRFKFWARRGTLSVPITKVIYDDYSACDSDIPTLVHSETVVTSSSSSSVTLTATSSSQYSGNTRYFSYNSHLFVIVTCGIVGILQGYITLDSSSSSGGDGTTLIGVYDGKTLRAKARMYGNKIYIDQPYDTASPSTYPMKGKQWEIRVYKV